MLKRGLAREAEQRGSTREQQRHELKGSEGRDMQGTPKTTHSTKTRNALQFLAHGIRSKSTANLSALGGGKGFAVASTAVLSAVRLVPIVSVAPPTFHPSRDLAWIRVPRPDCPLLLR